MDFGIGFGTGLLVGFLAWPWWAMLIFGIICFADIILLECEKEGFGSLVLFGGSIALAWFMIDLPEDQGFWGTTVWGNIGGIIQFGIMYFLIGILWSVIKWYLYLIRVKEDLLKLQSHRPDDKLERPRDSYASNNKDRIAGWIFHWPFSMIASAFGDVLVRGLDWVIKRLGNVYGAIGNKVFADFN